jgi:hypothetical protein
MVAKRYGYFRSGEVFCMDVGRMDAAVKPTGMY